MLAAIMVSLCTIGLLVWGGCSQADLTEAEMLAAVAEPDWADRETTRRRFEFILPRIVERCPDIETDLQATGMLLNALTLMENAGLEQDEGGMLGLSNALHSITTDLAVTSKASVIPGNCSDLWGAYTFLRKEGMSTDGAKVGAPVGASFLSAERKKRAK